MSKVTIEFLDRDGIYHCKTDDNIFFHATEDSKFPIRRWFYTFGDLEEVSDEDMDLAYESWSIKKGLTSDTKETFNDLIDIIL